MKATSCSKCFSSDQHDLCHGYFKDDFDETTEQLPEKATLESVSAVTGNFVVCFH